MGMSYMGKSYHAQTYTQEEINRNIRQLTASLDYNLSKRKDINLQIKHLKQQIEMWEGFDLSQTKIPM